MTELAAFVSLLPLKPGAAFAIACIRNKGSIFHQTQNGGGGDCVVCCVVASGPWMHVCFSDSA